LMEMVDADYEMPPTGALGQSVAPALSANNFHDLMEEPAVSSLQLMASNTPSAKMSREKLPDNTHENCKDRGRESRKEMQQLHSQHHQLQQAEGKGPGAGGVEAAFTGLQHNDQQTELEQLCARRTMLRNATELAVMRMVSHVCIVQAFAVYDNVIMKRPPGAVDSFVLRRLDPKNPDRRVPHLHRHRPGAL
ncbi:hypothetical protein VaNZ11_010858, partial [Volvox africanus]